MAKTISKLPSPGRFYIYIDEKRSAWVKKQTEKANLSYSNFLVALIDDKMNSDEDFCPTPIYVNMSSKVKQQEKNPAKKA